MTQQNAARLFEAVKRDQALQQKLKATANPEAFIKIAHERGYEFTVAELETEIDKLSEEDLAAIVNPGWGLDATLILDNSYFRKLKVWEKLDFQRDL